jgi:hypothetical protein
MVQHVANRMRTISIGMLPRATRLLAVLATVALLFAVQLAWAAPIAIESNGTPHFAMEIPDGFERVPVDRGSDVFAMFRRTRDEVLLVFARLPDELPQGTHDDRLWPIAHRSDPFTFADRPAHFRALGFDLEGARGEASTGARTIVRWMTIVPTEGRAIAILAVAPAEHADDARRSLEQVLASMRGASSWRTPLQHGIENAARFGFVLALAICVLYAVLLGLFFRGRPERAPIARGLLLTTGGIGWLLFSASWFTQAGFTAHVVGFVVAMLGVILAAQGLGIVRRRHA